LGRLAAEVVERLQKMIELLQMSLELCKGQRHREGTVERGELARRFCTA
jgi:hypothetical protein